MQPAWKRERWRDGGDRGLAMYGLWCWVLCVHCRTAGNAWSIIHTCGVQFHWNRRIVASVWSRRPQGGANIWSSRGCRKDSIQVPIQGQAGAGVPIGPAAYVRACHPGPVVALHMAGGVKGARASFPHVALQGWSSRDTKSWVLTTQMPWTMWSRVRQKGRSHQNEGLARHGWLPAVAATLLRWICVHTCSGKSDQNNANSTTLTSCLAFTYELNNNVHKVKLIWEKH